MITRNGQQRITIVFVWRVILAHLFNEPLCTVTAGHIITFVLINWHAIYR